MPKLSPITIIIIVAAVLAAGVSLYTIPRITFTPLPSFSPLPTETPQSQASAPTSEDHTPAAGDVGIITKNADGTSTYTSNKYKFRFSYPSTWRVGDNRIGYGSLQLLNFPEPKANDTRRVFGARIEMGIIDDSSSSVLRDFSSVMTETKIAGQKAYYFKPKNPDESEEPYFISYVIALPSQPGKYVIITLYSGSTNYPVLENLLKSIVWL